MELNSYVIAFLTHAHLLYVAPWLAVLVAACSATDAAFPQPAPGSHWLPLRKLVSVLAANLGNAKNKGQPPFASWLARVLAPLIQAEAVALAARMPDPFTTRRAASVAVVLPPEGGGASVNPTPNPTPAAAPAAA